MESLNNFLMRHFKILKSIVSLDIVNVHLRLETQRIPTLQEDISPLTIKEMDMMDDDQIKKWLEIINDSFGRNWKQKNYQEKVLNNPLINVLKTFFVMDGERPIGVSSIGLWRKNPEIGAGHYGAILKEYHNRGIGKYLFLFRVHALKDLGVEIIDAQSNLSHPKSLFIHFDSGYLIKDGPDYWNTPDYFPRIIRRLVNARLKKLYVEWKEHRKISD